MPDYGFAPDADFPIIYAEKGIVDFYMSKSYAETSGHAPFINDEDPLTLLSFYSGERLNMVPERAVVKLTGFSSKQHLLATQRSFEDYIKKINGNGYVTIEENQLVLETRGRSAHGSEPSKGINAAFLMLQFLKDLSLKKMDKQFVELLEWLFEKATQARFGDAWYDDMSGYLTLNVGKVMYLHQGKAGIGINLRYPVTASYDQVMKVIKVKAEEEQFHLDQLDHTSAHYVSPEHPLIKTLARVYREQTETHPQLLTIGGGTYARALRAGVAFGPLFPGKEDTAHQVNEYIEIEDLLKATAIYAQAIYELACIKNL
jgi:succinyl-diaminopimelate desuccinylase